MANDKIKAGLEVLGNKKKFSRAMIVVIALCVTIVIIAGIGVPALKHINENNFIHITEF